MPFVWADTKIRNSFQTSGAGRLAGNGKTRDSFQTSGAGRLADNRKISQERARLSAAADKSPFQIFQARRTDGTATACLGLIKAGQGYIPNTVLKEDIRNLIPSPPGKIFAILRKPVGQVQYAELTYQSPKCRVTVKALPPNLLSKIDNHLLSQLSATPPDYP